MELREKKSDHECTEQYPDTQQVTAGYLGSAGHRRDREVGIA